MKNNLLLVNLPCHSTMQDFVENKYNYNPSLGLLAITEYLTMFGFNSYIQDYNYSEMNYFELNNFIEENNITVVGITVYTENLNILFKFARTLKSLKKDIIIIAGGPHATLRPEEVIKSKSIDYVTTKDGESTFLELMLYLEKGEEVININDIKGLIYKNNNEKIINESRNGVTELDLLPIVNRERVDISRYKTVVTMYSSKGCPGLCIYCSASSISGARYRMRNIRNVFLECQLIYHQIGKTTNKIFFIDDTFTVNTRRLKEFCDLCNTMDFKMLWSCESRVDVMTEEIADLIAKSKCYSIQFGVESGNQDVLNSLRKHIDLKHLENIVGYLSKYNIGVFTSFIIGHYTDTEETMLETIEFSRKLRRLNMNVDFAISINTPFPGTWQYENSEEIGLNIIDKDYSHYNLATPVFTTKNFDIEKLLEIYAKSNSYSYLNEKKA